MWPTLRWTAPIQWVDALPRSLAMRTLIALFAIASTRHYQDITSYVNTADVRHYKCIRPRPSILHPRLIVFLSPSTLRLLSFPTRVSPQSVCIGSSKRPLAISFTPPSHARDRSSLNKVDRQASVVQTTRRLSLCLQGSTGLPVLQATTVFPSI